MTSWVTLTVENFCLRKPAEVQELICHLLQSSAKTNYLLKTAHFVAYCPLHAGISVKNFLNFTTKCLGNSTVENSKNYMCLIRARQLDSRLTWNKDTSLMSEWWSCLKFGISLMSGIIKNWAKIGLEIEGQPRCAFAYLCRGKPNKYNRRC